MKYLLVQMNNLVSEIETGIEFLKNNDARLRAIIEVTPPCSIKLQKRYFLRLIEIIISQQLSVKAADSIFNRFIAHFGEAVKPSTILKTSPELIRSFGLSTSKVNFIKDVAEKIENKQLKLKQFYHMTEEEIRKELIQIKGIGVWSCDMYLMFTLGKLNILPVHDLGIRKGVQKIYHLRELPDETKIRTIAKKNNWHPYCSIASWYLWRSLEMES